MSSAAGPSSEMKNIVPTRPYIRYYRKVESSTVPAPTADDPNATSEDWTLTLSINVPWRYGLDTAQFQRDVEESLVNSTVKPVMGMIPSPADLSNPPTGPPTHGQAVLSQYIQGAFEFALDKQGRGGLSGPRGTIMVQDTWGGESKAKFWEEHAQSGVTCTVTNPHWRDSLSVPKTE